MYSLRRLVAKFTMRHALGMTLLLLVGLYIITLTRKRTQVADLVRRNWISAPIATSDPTSVQAQAQMEKYWNEQRWERLNTAHISPKSDGMVRVLLASDERTLPGMITAINSIRRNTKHPIKFYLMTNEHTRPHLEEWITKSDELMKINYTIAEFDMASIQDVITVRGPRRELMDPLNYARYYVLDYFSDITGRLIYIDSDCIVQGDVKELHDFQFEDENIIAFSDDCNPAFNKLNVGANTYRHYLNFSNPTVRKLHLNPKTCSFNAGVYVTDMEAWRQNDVSVELDYWMLENHKTEIYGGSKHSYGSQPPMMIVFYEKYQKLPAPWNVRHIGNVESKGLYSDSFIKKAKLLHWNGPTKPWRDERALYRSAWKRYFVPDPTMKFLVP